MDSHDLTDIINTVKTPNTKLVLLIEKNKLPKDPIGDAYWAPVKHTNFKSMPRGDEDDIMRALQNGDGDLYGY